MTEDKAYTVFRVARTPAEAHLVRGLLQGAGIPAHIEGDMLSDEFAMSQRLMNVQGVRVFVHSENIERANEILAEAQVPDDELERQALAAAPNEADAPGAGGRARGGPSIVTLVMAVMVVLFFAMWMEERATARGGDPLTRMEMLQDGILWRWRDNGAEALAQLDRDGDGIFELTRVYDRSGRLMHVAHDADADGLTELVVEHREDGIRFHWRDDDRDGLHDRCEIRDADDKLLREMRYAGAQGFVVSK